MAINPFEYSQEPTDRYADDEAFQHRLVDTVDEIIGQWHREVPSLDVSPLEVFGRLHRTFLLYRSAINATFLSNGTTEPGFDVLAALRRSGPPFALTAGELAGQTLVTTGGLSLRIRRLEEDGLVSRKRDEDDHRVVHVQLSAAGLKLIDRTTEEHYANLRKLLSGVTPDDERCLAELLSRLYESIVTADPSLPSQSDR